MFSAPAGPPGPSVSEPNTQDLAEKLGLRTRAGLEFYDLAMVGGGPAGLAAAVYGASERLKIVMVEREAPGNIAPGHPDFRAALDRFSKHPLWRGIRINAANISKSPGDLKLLMEKNLSLDVLVGQPVYEEIARLAEALPKLRIIVGHLPLDDSTGIRACAAHRNIYAKVSRI